MKEHSSHEKATFAMGCFWQPDYIFSKTLGVISTKVGYAGCNPSVKNPTYEQVCSVDTGCAEAIEIVFDPKKITYLKLLDIFWTRHDPTQNDGQGPDIGPHYRSAIFYHTEKQLKEILASRALWEKRLIEKNKPIVTELSPAGTFYKAEDYHQKYLDKTGRSCHLSRNVFK